MGADIIWSHPNKPLEKHIKGVLLKFEKNCNFPIGKVAVQFHDLGKFNPNFQNKISGEPSQGYSNHAYLSVIIFYNFLLSNQKIAEELLCAKSSDLRLKILQVISIIAHHHGNLPDLNNILNKEEIFSAGTFVSSSPINVSPFLMEKLGIDHEAFSLVFNERQLQSITTFDPIKYGKIWQENALENFMETQFAFSCLIEADKRDASDNEEYQNQQRILECSSNLIDKLEKRFSVIDSNPAPSKLNQLRTKLRHEAVENIRLHLIKGKRIFSLPAPTGAGKTYTLLALAKEIIKFDQNCGVTYILPFLSITDQVEGILKELEIECLTISSKSENRILEKAQANYESNPTVENLEFLLKQSFSESTFDHPFILTTFVQFFETLMSNRNSTLLKLPNFSNRVFLIDEIQALPPRLYIFFSAWLEEFCRRHNSYVVFSTATMPKFALPEKSYSIERALFNPASLFKNYKNDSVAELIKSDAFFADAVFNRYKIDWINEKEMEFPELIEHINNQLDSCLIILNTIADTQHLYRQIKHSFAEVILLNTHFTVQDRNEKISKIKKLLESKEQVIVISTQLIEAGVDVDFPIVYRDLCPLPSLIQSAGRCNRNKKQDFGQVYFFILKNEEGKRSSELIYRKEAKDFIKFCKDEIRSGITEKDLFVIQKHFFEKIKDDLAIGDFVWKIDRFRNEKKENFIECVNTASFEKVGRFKLIVESEFGDTYQYYIPESEDDDRYNKLVNLMLSGLQKKNIKEKFANKIKIEAALKNISGRLVTVRIKNKDTAPQFSNPEEYFGIRVLADLLKYTTEEGINLGFDNNFL